MKILTNVFRFIPAAFFTLALLCPLASSAFVSPGDNDYFFLEEEQYRIIFGRQYLESIDTISRKIGIHLETMSKFKGRTLDEKLTIILISPKTQVSNAFATVLPSLTIGLYPVGIIALHDLSLPVWFEGVFEHELNHIFQMSHSKSPKIIKKLFNTPSLLFFYLYNPYPNIYMPRFILEGDSVLKESLFHYGGRLYNGYVRALVYSQLKHYQDQTKRFMKQNLLSFQLMPHSGTEKYAHGGYFMAMLAETYSHKTVNSFFRVDKKAPSRKIRKKIKKAPVEEFLSPLFAEHFSVRYIGLFIKELTKSYFNHWLKEASRQKSSKESVLFKSALCPAFGAKGDEIFFLTSDHRSVPVLRILNKKTKNWESKKLDLPPDKVFKVKDTYHARSRQEVKPHTIHYSLFSEGLLNNEQFDSKYVQDLWKDKTLYIDPKDNLTGFKLYVNDSFYSHTHSNALFDKKGNIYFFKQKNKMRTLYKNKRALFSYSGYYGSVLDVGSDGTVYFTGSSPYGSSIYQYKNGRISRSVSSDTVIQAKSINNREFIACEITPEGYDYKIIPKKLSREKPVLYKYKFKKRKPLRMVENSSRFSTDNFSSEGSVSTAQAFIAQTETSNPEREISSTVKKSQKNKPDSLKYKEYSPFKHIHYKGGNFQGIFSGITLFSANFLFSDYLLHHLVTPIYFTAFPLWYPERGVHIAGLGYQNRVHPLEWKLGYQISLSKLSSASEDSSDSEKIVLSNTDISEKSVSVDIDHKGYLQLNYPLFKKGRWFSSVSSLKIGDLSGKLSTFSGAEGLWRGQINWGYSQSFPYNYAPNKSFVLSLFFDNRYDFDESLNGFKSGVIWDSALHLGREFYIFPSASYARSFQPNRNPVRVSLYKKATFKDSDYENLSAFFHSSDPYKANFEDLGSSYFVTGDILGDIFKSSYKAESIGTLSLGLKKAYDVSLWNWKSRFVPLLRIRWLILEDWISHDTRTDRADNIVSADSEPLKKEISTENIEKLVRLSEKEDEEKVEKASQYIQWLEWTFGLESEFTIADRARLILGFSFGLRTPLKFWEKGNSTNGVESEGSSIGGRFDDIGKGSYEQSAFTNIYLKMPL